MPRQKSTGMLISQRFFLEELNQFLSIRTKIMQNYLKLLQFLKAHKGIFVIAIALMFVATIFEGFQLTLMIPVTDRILSNQKIVVPNNLPPFVTSIVEHLNSLEQAKVLTLIITVILVGMLLKQFFTFWYSYLMNDVAQRIMRDIRYQLYAKIQSFSMDYFSKKRVGELISRITHDVNVLENAVSYGVTDLFRQSFTILIFLFMVFSIYPLGAAFVFLIFPLIGFPMSKIGRRLKKISKGTQEKMADINSHLLETISGIKLVKASSNEIYETNRYKEKNHDYYKLRMQSIRRLIIITPITEILGAAFAAILIYILGGRIISGELSGGVFVMFFGCFMSMISPIKKLGNVNAITQQALAANERIYEVLDAEPSVKEKEQPVQLNEFKSSIRFDNVNFRYDDESGDVLRNINFEISKGELVAIVGPTGSGKTTLINLICRFYDPTQGSISFDGKNLKDVSFNSLRGQIGMVTQETILFNDTVRNNIAYGQPKATEKQLIDASQQAFAHDFIQKMPQGYETVIGDRGFRLSGGEKQRLSIARAMLRNPPILILDEATSQLDSESEQFIQQALDKLMRKRTVVAIAHRLSTITKADKIIVLQSGRVIGVGRHEELLESCELYKRLYSIQFQTEGIA
jgi:subfamily B ATP-binding cassette protein MsbA